MKKVIFVLLGLAPFILQAQVDIADARANYNIDEEVTVSGVVTNGNNLGSVRYIQDSSAGIAIYPGTNWDGFDDPQVGDHVTITGVLSEYAGLLEVGPTLTEVIINSSDNALPEVQVITANQMNESMEGELAQIEAALFENGGSTIQGNSSNNFIANSETGTAYFRNDHEMIGTILPAGSTTLIGVVSQFDFDGVGGYQLLPRWPEDLIPESAINIASAVTQTYITTSSFVLNWSTDALGDSKVEYGLTEDLGLEVYDALESTTHAVTLEGLEAGSIYYARVSSASGEDESVSIIRPYATVSNSSGDILVYFNHAVETAVATIEEAQNLGADMNDTIAAYITRAQHTLDIAVYNINNSLLVSAINTAYEAGVVVRYIAEGSNANFGIGDFVDGIPVQYRTDGQGSGMHNKFVIADADYEDQAVVLTGSTNFTDNNLTDDYNNLIIFQDQSLARAFTLEFNEMWGSDGPEPNDEVSKFGSDKTKNTPTQFIIGGSPVELHFSPTDGTTNAIREAILTTDYDLEFSLLAFTRDELADAIIEVGESIFINPQGVMEQINNAGSEYDVLIAAGIDVYSHQGFGTQLHHKYCIIDESEPLSDPLVITGSHNWSSTAENINDENTVIVHDARIANLYYQEYVATIEELDTSIDEVSMSNQAVVFPNPSTSGFNLKTSGWEIGTVVQVINTQGQVVKKLYLTGQNIFVPVHELHAGMYKIVLLNGDRKGVVTVIKQ
jgi:hypothetical protein